MPVSFDSGNTWTLSLTGVDTPFGTFKDKEMITGPRRVSSFWIVQPDMLYRFGQNKLQFTQDTLHNSLTASPPFRLTFTVLADLLTARFAGSCITRDVAVRKPSGN